MSLSCIADDAELFSSLIEHVGLDGLIMIISVLKRIANLPSSLLPSSARIKTITELVNSYTRLNVPEHKIFVLLNQLNFHSTFLSHLTQASIAFDSFLSNSIASNNEKLSPLFTSKAILPFSMRCTTCNNSLSNFDYHNTRILYIEKYTSCTVVIGIYKICHLKFGPSCVIKSDESQYIFTQESISYSDVFYVSGNIAWSISLIKFFSNLFTFTHCTFQGMCRPILDTYADNGVPLECTYDSLSKRFETSWLLYELTRFQLMLGLESNIIFPVSSKSISRTLHF